MTIKASWIGLGVMGFPMAGHLSTNTDVEVTVYNRSSEKAGKWLQKYKGKSAATPAAAAATADFVFACVGNDDDLRSVTLGPGGAFETMRAGSTFVDHTTASSDVARELFAEATRRGIGFVDAPVSGGQAGAENGTLTVMCGGRPDAIEAASPVMEAYTKRIVHVGKAGAGQTTKMVNQICVAGVSGTTIATSAPLPDCCRASSSCSFFTCSARAATSGEAVGGAVAASPHPSPLRHTAGAPPRVMISGICALPVAAATSADGRAPAAVACSGTAGEPSR